MGSFLETYNDSMMESWFHRSHGVSGFMGLVVLIGSWFHRFRGVSGFMVS